ncbi:LysR family transcriptional regulator [Primorskyibacter aestuariivivens]|uniref:LysR family transcriptional regulator n=1 Tax=Primorskyibacter aestuariivivens TaxID=1888912 RepID=UPI0022FFC516|nr:LysR family transcriptional regulator [Primorskyibacter aestuariivivens]MDA7428648.1 LysR family transcriptional regulator [Primorskyibacter aestuariivivens]
MRDDRLVEMRVFRAVVDTGGFSAAARVLEASQPFVSQTIQRLEARLGVTLLHRTTRGHRLTPEGARYMDLVRRTLAAIDAADAEWQDDAARLEGQLRVSAPIAFGLDRITPLIPEFLSRHPGLSLDLRLTDDHENLIEGGIDVAIRMGALPDASLMHRKLCRLRRLVVAAPDLVARHGLPGSVGDLSSLPCLAWDASRAHLNRWRFVDGNDTVTFHAQSRLRGNQGMSLFQMCLAGMGVMRVAEHLARPAIREGRLVQLLPDLRPADDTAIQAVFLPERQIVPRIRSFVDFVADAFRAPDWEA